MNKYDIKYIIKKILIYSGVAIVLMFVKCCDVKADTYSNYEIGNSVSITLTNNNNGTASGSKLFDNQPFYNLGSGEVNFSFIVRANNQIINGTKNVYSVTIVTLGDYEHYVCKIGTTNTYFDSSVQQPVYTANCPITFNNRGIYAIDFKAVNTNEQNVTITLSDFMSFHGSSNAAISNSVNDINNSINNDNVDNQQSNDFFNNFGSTTNEGLQDLIKKPIGIIDSFYNSCSPIEFDIPYFETTITLPCISSIQNDFTSVIFPIIRVIINGLICYRILIRFIDEINKLKDPNNSDLEVVDL